MSAENLARWLDSGDPWRWVWDRAGVWLDKEVVSLFASLREGPYWPLCEAEVRGALEAAGTVYRDLDRWGLLTAPVQPPPQDEDEVWF